MLAVVVGRACSPAVPERSRRVVRGVADAGPVTVGGAADVLGFGGKPTADGLASAPQGAVDDPDLGVRGRGANRTC